MRFIRYIIATFLYVEQAGQATEASAGQGDDCNGCNGCNEENRASAKRQRTRVSSLFARHEDADGGEGDGESGIDGGGFTSSFAFGFNNSWEQGGTHQGPRTSAGGFTFGF